MVGGESLHRGDVAWACSVKGVELFAGEVASGPWRSAHERLGGATPALGESGSKLHRDGETFRRIPRAESPCIRGQRPVAARDNDVLIRCHCSPSSPKPSSLRKRKPAAIPCQGSFATAAEFSARAGG